MGIPLWVILGPTAVGKSETAVEVASLIGGEIVVADSMQVYKGMDIGTAKLTEKEKIASNGRYIPHHLVDILTPDQPFSVAQYQEMARGAIEKIATAGKIPLLVGGTALYLRAVIEPTYHFPPLAPDPSVRERLRQEAQAEGAERLHRRLQELDPETARGLHPHDLRRVIRALEIYYLTGQPASRWRRQDRRSLPYDLNLFGLILPRPLLYERINRRVEAMLAKGWIEEVKKLLAEGYSPDLPAMKALGYRQIVAYLKGELNWEEMVRLIQRDTRHFAKRQMTWFRRDPRIQWLDVSQYCDYKVLAQEIVRRGSRTKGLGVEEYTSSEPLNHHRREKR